MVWKPSSTIRCRAFLNHYNSGDRRLAELPVPTSNGEEDLHFRFEFLTDEEAAASRAYVHLSELIVLKVPKIHDFVSSRIDSVDADLLKRPIEVVSTFVDTFAMREVLLFQEIDEELGYNDVLEVFERVNSGGTALSKSALLFSTLTLKIPDMEERSFRDCIPVLPTVSSISFTTSLWRRTEKPRACFLSMKLVPLWGDGRGRMATGSETSTYGTSTSC